MFGLAHKPRPYFYLETIGSPPPQFLKVPRPHPLCFPYGTPGLTCFFFFIIEYYNITGVKLVTYLMFDVQYQTSNNRVTGVTFVLIKYMFYTEI